MTQQNTHHHTTIGSLVEKFESSFARGDTADIIDFYTDDAMLLPTGFDFVHGKRNIESFWQTAMNMGIRGIKLNIIEVEQHADTAIEMSEYTLYGDNAAIFEQGKGIVIWKKINGAWKMHRDIWNSSTAH